MTDTVPSQSFGDLSILDLASIRKTKLGILKYLNFGRSLLIPICIAGSNILCRYLFVVVVAS